MTIIAESRSDYRTNDVRIEPRAATEQSDLLTALLAPCRLRCVISPPLRLTAPWGLDARQVSPGFVHVLDGTCELEFPGEENSWTLQERDTAILTRDGHARLLDRAGTPTISAMNLLRPADGVDGHGSASNSPGVTQFLCGAFRQEDDYTQQTFALLPPVIVLRSSLCTGAPWFRPLLDALLAETEQSLPGGELLRSRVVEILLIQALRQSTAELPPAGEGLLAALRIPGLGTTMGAIHSQPAHDWSVEELAEMAGLSRAAFAARFLEAVGQPPFHYLRDVRMRLACRMLCETEKGIKEVAARVGYSTEASFSKAFTRWCGKAPGVYRRQIKNGGGLPSSAAGDGVDRAADPN